MRNTLKLGTVYSHFRSENLEVKRTLYKALRFREKGYYHSPAYRQRRWDGYRNFFTLKTGQFLTGLLPEIKLALYKMKCEYDIVDTREPLEFALNKIDESFLWDRKHEKPVVLRDYQVDLTNQALKYKRGLIHAPTSAGKTAVLISLLKCLPPKTPVLVLVDTKELVHQNYEEIKHHGFDDVGMFFGDAKEPNYITVCLINSAPKLQKLYPMVRAIFVDEIHDMLSSRCIKLYKALNNADIRVAFSATPFKFGGRDKCHMFKVKGHIGAPLRTETVEGGKLTTKRLQEREILSAVDCTFYQIDSPQRQYDIYMDAVTYGIAQNDHLNQSVAKLVQKLKGRTLLVVERIEHGEYLQNLIPGSFWVHGSQKKSIRKSAIEDLKTHKGDFVAIAVDKIVNKGVNVFIHNLVNVAGGKADHQVIQRLGRGLRTADDKEKLHYYDFYFTLNPYLEKHSKERVRVLEGEGHKVEIKDEFDF